MKDYWFYTDNLPSHAYASMVYKYPQVAFPYGDLLNTNAQRSQAEGEYELFDALKADWLANRYFDVQVEYAKSTPEDVFCRITVTNRGTPGCADSRHTADLVPQYLVVGAGTDRSAHHQMR